jgi:acyl-CoA synthetase (AMP-forming)/AMP-acid ligase II
LLHNAGQWTPLPPTLGRERCAWAAHVDDLITGGDPAGVTMGDSGNVGGSMIYTAGTTGKPKGALRRAVDQAALLPRLSAFDLVRPHVHLAAGPLYHSAPGAFALYTHIFGGTVVVMPKFDPEEALALIARHRVSSTFMAPILLKRIVDLPESVRARHDVGSMQVIVMAAAPCPMKVKEDVARYFGPVLYEFYGSTELGVNTVLRPEDVLRKPGSCGRAAPGVELAVFDADGQPVKRGELFVKRYDGVFDEYYKKPEATRQTQRGDWLSVGDVAWIDDEGFVCRFSGIALAQRRAGRLWRAAPCERRSIVASSRGRASHRRRARIVTASNERRLAGRVRASTPLAQLCCWGEAGRSTP